jgi:hypothetical protein
VIGDTEYLTELRSKVPESKFKGSGVQNIFSITPGNKPVMYAVHLGSGDFKLDKKNPKTHIINAKRNSRGKDKGSFTFSVDADLSTFLLDEKYVRNSLNYQLNDKDFQLNISKSPSNNKGYTYSLQLSSTTVKTSNLSVKLLMNVPQWVEAMNDNDGLDINTPGAEQKTYGIKYIINGIYEAYIREKNYYTDIKININ